MNLELKHCEKFEQYLVDKYPHNGGIQYKYVFDNKYGASIIKHEFSYGHEEDLWELAVMYKNRLCYDTPITGDVEGYLTDKDVAKLLQEIKDLKAR